MIEVPLNSVWADMDSRCHGRTFRVDLITVRAGKVVAVCTILTNAEGAVTDRVGGRVTIDVGRFTPVNYRRIREES